MKEIRWTAFAGVVLSAGAVSLFTALQAGLGLEKSLYAAGAGAASAAGAFFVPPRVGAGWGAAEPAVPAATSSEVSRGDTDGNEEGAP